MAAPLPLNAWRYISIEYDPGADPRHYLLTDIAAGLTTRHEIQTEEREDMKHRSSTLSQNLDPGPAETGDEKKLDFGKVPLYLVPPEVLLPQVEARCRPLAAALIAWVRGAPGYLDDLKAALTAQAIAAAGPVLDFGAKKYSAFGWEKGIEFTRTASAGLRHALHLPNCGPTDPDTGLPHFNHLACNAMFALTYELRGSYSDFDDRPSPPELP